MMQAGPVRLAVIQRLALEDGEQAPRLHCRELIHAADLSLFVLDPFGTVVQIGVE